MTQIINWGIIGLGNVALEFAKAFKDSNNSKLIGISSNNQDKIQIFKEKFNDTGEMAEWFKAHAWKVCVLLKVPRVRIPVSPPNLKKPFKNETYSLLFIK
jgi:pyrroline-5-carboxylate reductase